MSSKRATSPRDNKYSTRGERESRNRGEEDTAKKVMPDKNTSANRGNAIRGERIK